MSALRGALDAANAFLAPAWEPGTEGILDRLCQHVGHDGSSNISSVVVEVALQHLVRIHEADIANESQGRISNEEGEYDGDSRTTLYGLLDLLAICGILPALSPGVSIRKRPKSLIGGLQEPKESERSFSQNAPLLTQIIDSLSEIISDPTQGLAPLVRERILTDVVAGAAQLAFSPESDFKTQTRYREVFERIVEKIQTSSALPLFTYLIHPETPQWLKPQLSNALSAVPLRPHGVRSTIEFIASSYPTPPMPANERERSAQKGPALPLEAISQASKLLSSVPSFMEPERYFSALAPQLLGMLDGIEGPDFSKAAALVIGSGILGKRATGAPGSIGWRLFAEPLLFDIAPPARGKSTSKNTPGVLVPEDRLKRALSRLAALLSSHPNPGLTSRLLGNLMMPLWALLDHAKSRPIARFWSDNARRLLLTYFRLGAGANQLERLATNLLWNGPDAWEYGPGSEGGVEVRHRQASVEDEGILEKMAMMEQRLESFQAILTSDSIEDHDIGELFVKLTKRWLLPKTISTEPGKRIKLEIGDEQDPLQSLIIAKIVMVMLEDFKDKLTSNPDNLIELVAQLLGQWVEDDRAKRKRSNDLKRANYAGLSNIVQTGARQSKPGQKDVDEPAQVEAGDIVPVALSLLNTLISAENFKPTVQTSATLSAILPTLELLRKPPPGSDLPASVSMTASNLTSQLSSLLNIPASPSKAAATSSKPSVISDHDRQTLNTALNDLTQSEHPPIRAAALSSIASLAAAQSPFPDLPGLTLFLLRTALPDPDGFVHLHAIKTLVALSARDPPLITRLLTDAFLDPKEEAVGEAGLEGRLRVGESLGKIVGEVRDASGSSSNPGAISNDARVVLGNISRAAVTVAGRRGKRPRDLKQRQRAAMVEQRKQREAEKAWGGAVPDIPGINAAEDDEDEKDGANAAEIEALSRIVTGWSETGISEDLRLRALALSVLSTAVEAPVTLSMLLRGSDTQRVVPEAVDVALKVLVLEQEERHVILRRAALIVLWSLIKGVDSNEDGNGLAGFLPPATWEEIEGVARWVQDTEADVLAKGHAGEVLVALEERKMGRAFGATPMDVGIFPTGMTSNLGLGELKGLSLNPDKKEGKRMVIEEIE
ncbi:uncharacterized protein J3D65DRAFT_628738 [Phyllosticta citribraziliensis]|uniref:Protein required for cell viability n=1 Tax=Phyllosticta citribraziliensis TaxID=989973 RepID=A0ABR1LPN5_9PEZI